MSVRDLVALHLEFTLEKRSTQPSLEETVTGLDARRAAWKPAPERHSIWQIVKHLINYHSAVVMAWDGQIPDESEFLKNEWQEITAVDDAAWEADLRLLRDLSDSLRARVSSADEELLAKPLAGWKRPRAVSLLFLATHAIYHTGQIRYLRALQGV